MNTEDIIQQALISFDTAQPVIRHLLRNAVISQTFRAPNDTTRTVLEFSDKVSGKVLFSTETENLAAFYDKLDVWCWSWSQVAMLNSENFLAKEMLLHAIKLGYELSYIKSILTTSRSRIKDRTQIDINLAIAASIIKQYYIYPYVFYINNDQLIYYIVLLNKAELDKIGAAISNDSNGFDEDE